ncbi:hypothetical protein [Chamaesiphon sp.]|uniref:hypothetical protein n=1 Tax=Chamaesiphon sp. TaxID=2814140 RepID=UPI003593F622
MYLTSLITVNLHLFAQVTPPSSAANGGIASAAANAAKDAMDSTNAMWAVLYNSSGVFGRIAGFSIGLAFIFLAWRIYKLYEEYGLNTEMQPWHVVQKLLMPLLFIILLSQSGGPAKKATYALRGLTQGFGISIIQNVGADMQADSAASQAAGITSVPLDPNANSATGQAAVKQFLATLNLCRLKPNTTNTSGGQSAQLTCAATAAAELKQTVEKAPVTDPAIVQYSQDMVAQIAQQQAAASGAGVNGNNAGGNVLDGLVNTAISVGSAISDPGAAFAKMGDELISLVLKCITIMFYWALELAAILLFYLLPLALAMGVADEKAMVDWFSQFWALCNAKICFAIVLALIATIAGRLGPLAYVFGMLSAIFAPFITFIFAKGSMIAVAEGLATAPINAAGAAAGGVAGGIGKAVKAGIAAKAGGTSDGAKIAGAVGRKAGSIGGKDKALLGRK